MQEGKEYRLPSGATLFVSVAPYDDVMALHDALAAELRGQGVGALDVSKVKKSFDAERAKRAAAAAGKPLEENDAADEGLNVIVDKMLAVIGSRAVKHALFTCAQKAVYRPDGSEASGIQFRMGVAGYGVFDNPAYLLQARGDFYDICKAVGEENLRPFGEALSSMFTALMGSSADTPASNTEKA